MKMNGTHEHMPFSSHAVVLVHGTSHAIRAERVLYLAGLECKLIPVPRHLSSDCGVCVRVRRLDREEVRAELERAKVEIEGIHDV